VTLWVLGGNVRARRFYEVTGMRPDGGAKVEVEGGAELPTCATGCPQYEMRADPVLREIALDAGRGEEHASTARTRISRRRSPEDAKSIGGVKPWAMDASAAERLWTLSEAWTALFVEARQQLTALEAVRRRAGRQG
jgi:hypothetical protein